jgi:UDP-galactopyranose mutase
MKYDFLVVGTGFFGSTFANIAHEKGYSIKMIEQRSIPGGNCSTQLMNGINVQIHGAHIFRTNSEEIWKYANKFTSFHPYLHRLKVKYKNQIYSFPINLMTMHQIWGVMTPEEAKAKLEEVRVPFENPKNMEEHCLSLIGEELYEIFIKGYSTKQWGRSPKELPAWLVKRIPVRFNLDDHYYHSDGRYEGIPIGGYTQMFENMLQGIDIEYNVNFLDNKKELLKCANKVIYTGCIDKFYDYQLGRLEYRSLDFLHEIHKGDYQGCSVINYADIDIPYTRIIEHKHFDKTQSEYTVITKEYPKAFIEGSEPYYPLNDETNNNLYKKYQNLSQEDNKVVFGGRLGSYKYYDMDHAIAASMTLSKRLLSQN